MLRDGMIFLFSRIAEVWCLLLILRPLENPKKQSDGGGRLNPSRFLFRLAFLSWPWRWYDVSLCFCKIPEFSGSYVDRVYSLPRVSASCWRRPPAGRPSG